MLGRLDGVSIISISLSLMVVLSSERASGSILISTYSTESGSILISTYSTESFLFVCLG